MSDEVTVRALAEHFEAADPAVDRREAGEVYETTPGVARRRERAVLVEIDPDAGPEDDAEPQEDLEEAGEGASTDEQAPVEAPTDVEPPNTRSQSPELETKG